MIPPSGDAFHMPGYVEVGPVGAQSKFARSVLERSFRLAEIDLATCLDVIALATRGAAEHRFRIGALSGSH